MPKNRFSLRHRQYTSAYFWVKVLRFSLSEELSEIIIKVIRTFSYYYPTLQPIIRGTSYQATTQKQTDQLAA